MGGRDEVFVKGDLSVIIATMNREDALLRCLKSLEAQSHLPGEIVIIDDGEGDEGKIRERIPSRLRLLYRKKSPPGLSASRNLGAKLASGEFLLFLDDDVELHPDFIREILRPFQEDGEGKVGAVGGMIVNRRPKPRIFRRWARLFLLDRGKPGEILPWGFHTEVDPTLDRVIDVDWVPGGLSCFRRQVFQEFQLSDMGRPGRHGLADVEFCWRISRRYRIKLTPFARLRHYPPSRGWRGSFRRGYNQAAGHCHLFRTHASKTLLNRARFLWAMTGLTLGNLGAALLVGEKNQRLARILQGLGNLLGLMVHLRDLAA